MVKVKERILKAAREKKSHTQGNPYKAISWFFCRNFEKPEGSSMIYLKCWKGKTYNLGYSTQQDYHSELKDR